MPEASKIVNVTQSLPALNAAIRDGETVIITESLADSTLLQGQGLPAVCGEDPDLFDIVSPDFFTGARVAVLHSRTEGGEQLASYIKDTLERFAHSIFTGALCDAVTDNVSAFFQRTGCDGKSFMNVLSAAVPTYAPWIELTNRGISVNADTLAHSISKNVAYLNVRQCGEVKQRLFLFRNGVYERAAKTDMDAMIRRYLPVGTGKSSILTEVGKLLLCCEEHYCALAELDSDARYINFRNGLLNVETMELEDPRPEVLSTLQISCNYDPEDKDMPVFRRFLTTLCTDPEGQYDAEREAVLQEFSGLAISNVPARFLKKALMLYYPEGNTGKSQFLGLLNDLVGGDHIANISMQDMGSSNRFCLGPLIGKRLVCVGDQGGSVIKDGSVFKELTGGDPVKSEEKFKDPQTIQWNGAILLACNVLPTILDDHGNHMFERLEILPFYNVIPESERDPEILAKILKEKSAVVNWMLQGLRRLMENGYKLTPCAASEEVMEEYRMRQDTVSAFLSSRYCITKRDKDRVEKAFFEAEYGVWCTQNDMDPLPPRELNRRLKDLGLTVKQARFKSHTGIMAVCGIIRKEPAIAVA